MGNQSVSVNSGVPGVQVQAGLAAAVVSTCVNVRETARLHVNRVGSNGKTACGPLMIFLHATLHHTVTRPVNE